jgi:hypothetical protein
MQVTLKGISKQRPQHGHKYTTPQGLQAPTIHHPANPDVKITTNPQVTTMSDRYSSLKQRAVLLAFAEALDSASAALRRDECGDWRIGGTVGKVFASLGTIDQPKTPGYAIYVERETSRAWTAAKSKLGFCRLTNDGDSEGLLSLDRLPTPDEAEAIRSACGIKKKRAYSEETLAALLLQLPTGRQAQAKLLQSELADACA